MFLALIIQLAAAQDTFPTDPSAVLERKDAGAVGDVELSVVRTAHGTQGEGHFACTKYVWWLERKQGDAVTRRNLVNYCNDGYGAAGVGEDSVEVGPNRFAYTKSGGSAWRWSATTVLQLEPLAIVEQGGTSFHNAMQDVSGYRWNAVDFRGAVDDRFSVCGEEDAGTSTVLEAPAIPLITGLSEGPTARLGRCALTVDSQEGPIVHGEPGEPGDATLAVVATDAQEWRVEITDDTWVPTSDKSWILADHLELWVSYDSSFQLGCEADAVQYGVMLDGTVHPAHGEPNQVVTARVLSQTDEAVQLAISLAARPWRVSVVYSDSDDGKRQERLIGTSPVKRGQATTLGRIVTTGQSCRADDGLYEPLPAAFPDDAGLSVIKDW